MDIFAFIVLEDTLDKLAKRRSPLQKHSRMDECMTVIRACMDLIVINPDSGIYTNKIRQALAELAGIARQNGEITVAGRLKMVVQQLGSAGGVQRRYVQAA